MPGDQSSSETVVKRNPDFGNLPLHFIPNKGQVDEQARFYAKTSRYTLWMTMLMHWQWIAVAVPM
jgi:hypothetical protein